jgi:hypothetical protein
MASASSSSILRNLARTQLAASPRAHVASDRLLLRNVKTSAERTALLSTSTSLRKDKPVEEEPALGEAPKKGSSASDLVKSVFYGSPTAQDEERKAQQHSKLVGRGKYVHEIQTHKVIPGKVEEYKALIGDYYKSIADSPEFALRLTGSWEIIVGELDTFVHIWEYEQMGGFESSKYKVRHSEPHFETFNKKILPLIQSRTNQLVQEFSFWPSSPPKVLGGVYEMRSYQLRPGTLLEWEGEWRRGLEARRRFVEPIGAWFAQVGKLHQVHHMWQYADMEARKTTREKAWQIDTWSQTVSKTVKLCYEMHSNILAPMPHSPLR